MAGSLARHLTLYFHSGFWVAVSAAILNGVYWRLPISPLSHQLLAASTLCIAVLAVLMNAHILRRRDASGRRTGRRVTWLLLCIGVMVAGSVIIDISGLRRAWGLP